MGFRDRFYTPTTAKALLSWRILVGVGLGAALTVAGLPIAVAAAAGIGVYAATVARAMPKGRSRHAIDPFVLSEPWRRLMQQAQGAGRKLRATVAGADDGPLRETMMDIVDQLDHGLDEAWEIAPSLVNMGLAAVDLAGLAEIRAYLEYCRSECRDRFDRGLSVADAAVDLSFDRWSDWGEPERIVTLVNTCYREFGVDTPSTVTDLFGAMAELWADQRA